jgi:hypothetical protein
MLQPPTGTVFGNPQAIRAKPEYGSMNRSTSRWGPNGELNTLTASGCIVAEFVRPQGNSKTCHALFFMILEGTPSRLLPS